ncbi:MAG TPA: DUF58 domain-containing protein [Roseiflexaceae bacterium]|nr:DUF58 domain-containing protein [Roseiflexaceae bacterium]
MNVLFDNLRRLGSAFSLQRSAFARWLTLHGRLSLAQPWALVPGPALLLLALMAPYRWLFFAAYAFLFLALAAYLWARALGRGVTLRRRLESAWAQVGDDLEEQWEVVNRARVPLLWLEIDDASTLPRYTGRRVAAAGIGERVRWTTRAPCARRGIYTLGPLRLRTGDPLGVFAVSWRQGEAEQIVIYPPLARLPALRFPRGQRGGLARTDLLQQQLTPSVGGLRDYVPGDMPSHIHWPTVARQQKLVVKEFDQEVAGALWIALDLRAASYGSADRRPLADEPQADVADPYAVYGQSSVVAAPSGADAWDSPLELAVALAASLAAHALGEGRAVGLLADDGRRRVVPPGRGPRQLWRILGELVDAQAAGSLPLAEVVRQGRAAQGAEMVGAGLAVVTPDTGGGWLAALAEWQRGRPGGGLALLVSARGGERATQALEAQLAELGVPAYRFEVGRPLALLNPPKPRPVTRVSPLGRVMRG